MQAHRVKLPPLWKEDIETWFVSAEAQFAIHGVDDEAMRFNLVISVLDDTTSSVIKTLIRNPPRKAPYSTLKQALVQKYLPSQFERADAIYNIQGLGDRKPSELMDEMLRHLGDNAPGMMFLYHFIQLMPDYVRSVLATSKEQDPTKLALFADRVFAAGRPSIPPTPLQAAAIAAPQSDTSTSVDRVERAPGRRGNSSGSRRHEQNHLCYYHYHFGERASKCRQPCAWSGRPVSQATSSGNWPRGQQRS
jgi:hypothetical protein